jgi:hypothetical protein
MTKELRQADLDPARFQEILKAAAGGEDYRVIVPGVGVVRILPEPEQLSPDAFAKMLAHPGVARRLDRAVDEVKRGDVIADEDMDEVFRG